MARPPRLHFCDEDLDGRLARTPSMAVVSAADLGEATAAASHVDRPDRDRWHATWAGAAAAAEDAAAAATAAGDRAGARAASLRAGGHCAGLGQQVRAAAVHPRLHRVLADRVSAGAGTR
ncbi:hypothetical protein [Geodermatophilus sp. URMC 62]|uniref:hypothetical protein n=1 Tax=Geodermatophilus sp. URMC 62 TaxID=3423414 RepID=UPI00406D281D